MAKQTEFENPPGGHIGMLVWDSVNKKWYSVLGDSDGHIQIEVTAVALPTGAAIESKQLADGHNVTVDNVSLAVTGAFYPGTQPVSVASLPLPSGAAIESKQTTQITTLQSIQNLVGALASVNINELRVNVIAELPAGTKNIGDVDIASMPTVTVQSAGGDKIIGFESIVEEQLADDDLDATTKLILGTAVDPDKVWKITQVAVRYRGTVPSSVQVQAVGLGGDIHIIHQLSPTSELWYMWSGVIYMQSGDYIRVGVWDATVNDDLYCRYSGIQMNAP